MAPNQIEDIGNEFVKRLFSSLTFNVAEYCEAEIDAAFDYCIQEFKKACEIESIPWREEWESILYE